MGTRGGKGAKAAVGAEEVGDWAEQAGWWEWHSFASLVKGVRVV